MLNLKEKFGYLTIEKQRLDLGNTMYECTCRCGKKVYATEYNITHGRIVSCGCYKAEMSKQRIAKGVIKEGMERNGTTNAPKSRVRYINDEHGVTDSVSGWAKRLGITRQTLHERLKRYTPEEAIKLGGPKK